MSEDIKKAFGKNLKQIRKAKQISQEELAFRANLHRTYISSIESGERNISFITIKKIADALGVKLKDLIP